MASKNRSKNKELNFKDKLKLIEDNNNKQTTQRKLAAKYGVSKSQVQRVLTNKENISKQKNNRSYSKRHRVQRKLMMNCFTFDCIL